MNSAQFVEMVKVVVSQNAARGVLSALKAPPGRKPDPMLVQLSQWFNERSSEEQTLIEKLLARATDQAAYNFLLALDDLVAISDQEPRPRLELFAVDEVSRQRLNDPNGEELSSLFKT
jgi:hypothetical protein